VSRGIVPLRNDPDFRPVALGVRPVPSHDHMRQSRPPSLDRDALETDHARSPSGTVTFLFTDIEGSTALWERDRAAMHTAVARHIALLNRRSGSTRVFI
jgi:class 3 adenylate cyclase